MMYNSSPAVIRRYYFTAEQTQGKVDFVGSNLYGNLAPRVGARRQLAVYTVKRLSSIFGLLGGIACLIVASTACMEVTGSEYSPDANGDWSTHEVTEMNSTGIALSWMSLAMGVGAAYSAITWPINLRLSVRRHNRNCDDTGQSY